LKAVKSKNDPTKKSDTVGDIYSYLLEPINKAIKYMVKSMEIVLKLQK